MNFDKFYYTNLMDCVMIQEQIFRLELKRSSGKPVWKDTERNEPDDKISFIR